MRSDRVRPRDSCVHFRLRPHIVVVLWLSGSYALAHVPASSLFFQSSASAATPSVDMSILQLATPSPTARLLRSHLRLRMQQVETESHVPALPPRLARLAAVLKNAPDDRERLKRLVRIGDRLPRSSLALLAAEGTRVRGCTSVVDLLALTESHGALRLEGRADSRIARGLVALLVRGLRGAPAELVLATRADALAEALLSAAGLPRVLGARRQDGVGAMLLTIREQLETAAETGTKAHGGSVDSSSPPSSAASSSPPSSAASSSPPSSAASSSSAMASAPPSSWATASAASRWPRASEEVAVLLSGGVDSSVALRLLHDAGVRCRAFYLRIWLEDEQAHASRGECPWEEDWACASAVCEQAGVPLEAVSLQDEYSQLVVEYLISEAAAGRTPNPDIMCNSRIKFGAFLDKVGRHFAAVASGHYARSTVPTPSCAMVLDTRATRSAPDRSAAYATAMVAAHGDASTTSVLKERELEARVGQDGSGVASAELPAPAQLLMSADPHKDQTYFLSQLRQDQLERVLFPIGHLPKSEVRALAEELQLPNRQRKDSQGICFLGQLNYDDFLRDHLGERPGPVFEFETKQVIGTHRGLWFHTVGQRRGLVPVLTNAFAAKGPWYVVKKDVENNALHVSREYTAADKSRNAFNANSLNWLSGNPPAADGEQIPLQVKVRHGAQMHDALVTVHEGGARVGVQLSSRDKGLAPGQFAAFYDGDVCLGSGVIAEEVHS